MSSRQPMKILKGDGKQLEVYEDRVMIRRTDALATLMPNGFSDPTVTHFDQIARVDLHEPHPLRLKDCKGECLQLVITRHDHTTDSMALDWEQHTAAQEIQALIAAHISSEVSPPKPQNSHP